MANVLEINTRASGGTDLAMGGSGVSGITLLLDAAVGNIRYDFGETGVLVAESKTARIVSPALLEAGPALEQG
ncbi:hypothetical protein EHF33_14715 [Deinococcus psychrotolerans]|uniref:Uncharacterized protein n=1 Tax=Deinococcus psychrotolerans TaxID=2489213 RepID=A0A3G8YGQ9_9DEIO|nr:hypothetical protein [Deinococcus psychrotolerans]AZI44153.1 hypothetical protein EHF33_14715 [Deinococcus psychrotolerans]